MSKFRDAFGALALCLTLTIAASGAAQAQKYGLGRAATAEEVKAWDIDVRPDGAGLPAGSGSVEAGEEAYIERCAMCHGDFGEAIDRWPVLAGGHDTLESDDPVKTIGSYWPYLSTVWDYIHRAMPFGAAQTLSDDEVYAITAYILYMNDLVANDFVLSRENFLSVEMPNADGFFMDDREQSAVWKNRAPCMSDCKDDVKVTMRARVIDVTPDDPTSKRKSSSAAPTESETKVAAAATGSAPAGPDPALVAKGEKVFKKCKSCHAIGEGAKNKIGPHLNALYGRPVGGLDGFKKYSKAMKTAGKDGMVWSDETLAAFLAKPKAVIKKTKMSFSGLRKQSDLDAILAYLKAKGG